MDVRRKLQLRVGDGGKRGQQVWPGPARLTLVSGSAQCLGVLVSVLDRVSQRSTELEVLAVSRILLALRVWAGHAHEGALERVGRV